ncbi:MAG: ankyrin repeat domain-containing protein [Cytophagales bacterium]|nr:ankyrin repeat domain-containing protein [Cytophagales bacterium]
MHWAARAGCKEVVEYLLEAGANKEAKNKDGQTPMYWTEECGHRDVAELLKNFKR